VKYHPKLQGWDPSRQTRFADEYGFDPEAMRALIAEAGVRTFESAQGHIHRKRGRRAARLRRDTGEAIGAYWRAAGADVTLDTTEGSSVDTTTRARGYNQHYRMRNTSSSQYLSIWYFCPTATPARRRS
jgi:ABC-type transport system substrate-binding protein